VVPRSRILFQEMAENMGLMELSARLNDPSMAASFNGIFPRDIPRNTRFSINFFTSIGLGGLTDPMRDFLKNMPKMIMQQDQQVPTTGGVVSGLGVRVLGVGFFRVWGFRVLGLGFRVRV
jgi:hypothetical protein